MNKKVVAGIGLIATALGLFLWTRKAEAACTEGTTKCDAGNLYTCVANKWVLTEANSPACVITPPPECNEGGTECVGTDLYTCVNGKWELTATDSPICAVPPPPSPLPEGFEIDSISAEPSVVVLGNEVKIHIWWFCPNPNYEERTFALNCVIDGVTLQTFWGPTKMGNGAIDFIHTPQSIGTYTATVLDKSISFEVRQEVVGTYYSPFGGYTVYESLDALARSFDSNFEGKTVAGQGQSSDVIYCPYCTNYFTACVRPMGLSCTLGERIGAAYALLDHIQSSHPQYPLTKPRPHVEVTVPQLPSPVTGVWMSPGAYCVLIDGRCGEIGYTCAYPNPYGQPCNTWIFNNVGLFATLLGKHHVEVGGPLLGGCWMRAHMSRRGQVLPTLFSQDVTLQAVGDKVTIDVETGLMGYQEWRTPVGG